MKENLSALDISAIVKELQFLIEAKLDKFYQPEKREFLIQLHKTGYGKAMIKIFLEGLVFLTEHKKQNPEMAHSFCLRVRKILANSRLRAITQIGFERIVEFCFETREAKYKLIFELFSKGNAILCDEENKIKICLEKQFWKDRTIKPKETYVYPQKDFNFLKLTKEELKKVVELSSKENIIKTLAIDLGLGGIYAEELCLNAGIDKKKKNLEDSELEALFKAIEAFREKKLSPVIVKKEEEIIDILPFKINYYSGLKILEKDNFNKAIDEIFTEKEVSGIKAEKKSIKSKEVEKAKKTILIQERQLSGLQQSAEENQKKGEFIYEHYQEIESILNQINEARKKMSWKEIEEKLKDNKKVKNVDAKTGKVMLSLE